MRGGGGGTRGGLTGHGAAEPLLLAGSIDAEAILQFDEGGVADAEFGLPLCLVTMTLLD